MIAIDKDPPATHAERPTPRAELPFRRIGNVIEYMNTMSAGSPPRPVKIPMAMKIEEGPYANPLSGHILTLMQMYRELESMTDLHLAKIDSMSVELALAKGEITKLTAQVTEFRSRKPAKSKEES